MLWNIDGRDEAVEREPATLGTGLAGLTIRVSGLGDAGVRFNDGWQEWGEVILYTTLGGGHERRTWTSMHKTATFAEIGLGCCGSQTRDCLLAPVGTARYNMCHGIRQLYHLTRLLPCK